MHTYLFDTKKIFLTNMIKTMFYAIYYNIISLIIDEENKLFNIGSKLRWHIIFFVEMIQMQFSQLFNPF